MLTFKKIELDYPKIKSPVSSFVMGFLVLEGSVHIGLYVIKY